jgi:transcriptional regulator with XRE-family HTH domain
MELRSWLATGRALALRKDAGLARSSVARDLAVAESALWRWEHGQRIPRGTHAASYYRLLAKLDRAQAEQAAIVSADVATVAQ